MSSRERLLRKERKSNLVLKASRGVHRPISISFCAVFWIVWWPPNHSTAGTRILECRDGILFAPDIVWPIEKTSLHYSGWPRICRIGSRGAWCRTRRASAREGEQSEIRSPERMMSQGRAECLTWKGMPLFKTVFDFAIVPMLIWELKPATVFEIGSGTGASACWMADILSAFGLAASVYSVDLKAIGRTHPGVHFVVGDCMLPSSLFGAELLRSAPHPYLVIEDAHENVGEVLSYLDGFLNQGDYLFVEDSIEKQGVLKSFLSERPNRYLVDARYADLFGRNATSAIDSILVRV